MIECRRGWANGVEGKEGEISWPCEKREKLAVGSFSATKCMSADSVRTRHLAVYSNESRGVGYAVGDEEGTPTVSPREQRWREGTTGERYRAVK